MNKLLDYRKITQMASYGYDSMRIEITVKLRYD